MKKLLPYSLALLLFAALPASQPGGGRAQTRKPKGRALLVGINEYKNAPDVKPTRGAQEDATETARFIKAQYGFQDDEVLCLLGKEATAQSIRDEFRHWLIEGTQPGDRVFFLYAGHGSQIKDQPNGDESDGLDEVLAPYDVAWEEGGSFKNIIIDDELDVLISQLSGRHAVLVFDSCSSGTISRGSGGNQSASEGDARYLPRSDQLAQLPRLRSGGTPDYIVQDTRILRPATSSSGRTTPGAETAEQGNRDLNMVDVKKVGSNTGIVVISATQAAQIAYSLWINEPLRRQRGALSYVFAEAQRNRQPSVRQIRQEIKTRVADLQRAKRLQGDQVPQVEVISTIAIEDRPLFAAFPAVSPTSAVASTVVPGNPQSNIRLSLQTREGKTSYRIGESASYRFTTNATGYLYLIVFSEMDVATCIFPNEHLKSNRFDPGSHVITRDGRDGFGVTEPIGKDVVVALLSATPLNLGGNREAYTWDEVFAILKDARFGEYIRTRGQTSQKPAQLTNWQAVNLVLETVK